ncbi:inorganic pyrophosphatase [Eurytemora carolleeae]|uniref:inorganic pyrophosphatase n=1 Tax=Eurytemora carolleeae TaxID=1294199 RepID=UPI000C7792DC|nr:inorganic pyrophosphatase [Eurytemora carolleeae]|eukprot:XP_023322345.1 inorganic pyrophosphatase-like [Eurytemora affinis]
MNSSKRLVRSHLLSQLLLNQTDRCKPLSTSVTCCSTLFRSFPSCQPLDRSVTSCHKLRSLSFRFSAGNSSISSTRLFSFSSGLNMPVSAYTAVERGTSHSDSYKVFIRDDDGPISPFHDIPLDANVEPRTFHMVVEIPRWTNAKMEIDTKSALNPIIQDQKKGKLRYVGNSFPHHGYIWNYGAFPQTWENPNHVDENTGEKGDNDPVDVIEIGHRVAKRGDVLEVKVLGILAMIDDGETDWKVLVIDVTDPLADKLNGLEDVETLMPGFLNQTRDWFRIYKMPDGKPENQFAFNGEFKDAEFAHKIIDETHVYWRQLVGLDEVEEDPGKLDIGCVCVEGSNKVITREEAEKVFSETKEYVVGEEPASTVDTWHYTHLL